MKRYTLTVTLLSPVCIAKKRAIGNFIETLDYIPGSTIRGALAMLYIQQKGKDANFNQIFISDDVRFGNCYPDGAQTIPFTAASCKYSSGFWTKYSPGNGKHGVQDIMIEMARYEKMQDKLADDFESCRHCKSALDRYNGYYLQTGEDDFSPVKVSKRLIIRSAIMDSLETATHGKLYTLEVLNKYQEKNRSFIPQEFIGLVETSKEEWFEALGNLLIQSKNRIHIGMSKSRALGEVEIRLDDSKSRWLNWEEPLHNRVKEMNNKLNALGGYFFSVTFHSDAILLDEILRFRTTLKTDDLIDTLRDQPELPSQSYLEKFESTMRKFYNYRSWLAIHLTTGWNSALKLPKEDELAISDGSVFLFHTSQTLLDAERNNLIEKFNIIEQRGIGERRNEGFGKIRICDEFHLKEYK